MIRSLIKRLPMSGGAVTALCGLFAIIVTSLFWTGCATHPDGITRYDAFDEVTIDQMTGNNVAPKIFARQIVCLNARREAHKLPNVTNTLVTWLTNHTVVAVTNLTLTAATNLQVTLMTNVVPAQVPEAPTNSTAVAQGVVNGTHSASPAAATNDMSTATMTNGLTMPSNTVPSLSTHITITLASNQSSSRSPGQVSANNQIVRTLAHQLTTTSNNLSITLATNQIITLETNQLVSWITNQTIQPVTNITVISTNAMAVDYYLHAEWSTPPEFTIQPGESLVLLIDGVRHTFAQAPASTSVVNRRGFASALFRASPEVFDAIAGAREVRMRLKGVNDALERNLSRGSQTNFRVFLLSNLKSEGGS